MVEFVDPLAVEAIASFCRWIDIAGVVEVYFGDEGFPGAGALADLGGQFFELLEEGDSAAIENGVHGIQAQGVDVEVLQPEGGVLEKEISGTVTPGVVEVEGVAPGGLIQIGEIGAVQG